MRHVTQNSTAHYFPSNLALANLGKPSQSIKQPIIPAGVSITEFLASKAAKSSATK